MSTLITRAKLARDRALGRPEPTHLRGRLYLVTHSWGPSRANQYLVEALSRREACRIVRENTHCNGYPHRFHAKPATGRENAHPLNVGR